MKNVLSWIMIVLLAVSLSACVTTKSPPPTSAAPMHLKCPNCGFEFDVGHP